MGAIAVQEATDAWLGQVASMLKAQDQHLINPGRENASAVHRAARNRSSGKGKGKNIYRQILEGAPAANKQDAGAD
jgi:hypothetical protein